MKLLEDENYKISFDEEQACIAMSGILRLSGSAEYAPIVEFLDELLALEGQDICIDLTNLEFMNSSGIAVLSKFMISARKKQSGGVKVLGSQSIPWQAKSLKNLQRLLPALELEFE